MPYTAFMYLLTISISSKKLMIKVLKRLSLRDSIGGLEKDRLFCVDLWKGGKSVLGVATLNLVQASDPPLHAVTQVGEKLLLPAEKLPGSPHVEFQLGQVPGRLELLVEDPLEGRPQVFNWIAVGRLPRPVQQSDVLIGKPVHHPPRLVAGGSVLHEDLSPGLVESRSESLLHDVNIYSEHKTFITINSIKIN